ncbi:MAG: hypothetical protein ACI8XV_002340 [Arenicella sp.]|jgi:hypothetical protein
MKILVSLLFSLLLSITQYATAHGDHEHQEPRVISDAVALIVAQRAVTSMSRKDAGLGFGQLSDSWSTVAKQDMAIYKKGTGYYVASVLNKNEAKTLFLLMSDSGEVYDANFSGQFDGIE